MKIQESLKVFNYLFFSIVLFFAAFFLAKHYENSKDKGFNITRFSDILYEKEESLNNYVNQVSIWLGQNSEQFLFLDMGKKFRDELSKKGFQILIYKNNKLKYWTDNFFDISLSSDRFLEKNKIVFLGNTWFMCKVLNHKKNTIVGLIELQRTFDFENKFLKNAFHPDFLIRGQVEIVMDKNGTGIQIYNSSEQYLFTLKIQTKTDLPFKNKLVVLLLYGFGFVSVIIFLFKIKIPELSKLLIIFLALFLIRFFLWKYQIPEAIFSFEIFKAGIYNSSKLTPSFGDFFLHAIVVFIISLAFYKFFGQRAATGSKSKKRIWFLSTVIIVNVLIIQLYKIIEDLIINSSITYEVYKIQEFTAYTFLGFIILTLFLAAYVLFILKFSSIFKEVLAFKKFIAVYILSAFIIFAIIRLFLTNYGIFPVIIIHVFTLVLIYLRYISEHGFVSTVIVVGLISIFSYSIITEESIAKEKRQREVLASELAAEHDLIAELLLENVEKKIISDYQMVEYINAQEFNFDEIYDYIQKRYFVGFWNKYNLQLTFCTPFDSLLVQPDEKWTHCYEFFDTLLHNEGRKLENSDFYYLDNQSGQISYFGYFIFPYEDSEISMFLQLDSKLIAEELGYPELLYESEMSIGHEFGKYSYAKYKRNKLISQNGQFSYSLNMETYGKFNNEFTFFNLNAYDHLMHKVNDQTSIIISKPVITFLDGLISISYLFVFFYLITLVVNSIYNYKRNKKVKASFKRRIQISMISILLLSLITIGGGTIYYNIEQYQFRHYKSISEKIQSVLVELEHKLGYETHLDPEMNEYITSLLIKFSNVFYSDINLYDLEGNLFASSRHEIFDRNLTGRKMHPEAYAKIAVKKHIEFIHNEKIGRLSYASAYVPFYNKAGEMMAYLNLPYFSKQTELTEEISTFVVAIINIYVLLILLTIMVAIVISGEITRPLRLIQEKFRVIDFSKEGEQIYYKGNDEIGSLVKEYNRMVIELGEKADLLAKTEREIAWREMAKQIAHEIKNPLTPMKLNVQMLEKLWNDKDDDFENRMKRITHSLIEQINSLSAIATEFSGFAKMPKPNNKVLNIIKNLKDSITLFENSTSIKFEYNFHENDEIMVFADEEQLLRVFNNLIKNSVQALNDIADAKIIINTKLNTDFVVVEIKDNGKGISEETKDKLFRPSFTTKTGGMGLGLSIVKNIIESLKGKIWFETELNKGTSFYIEIPVHDSTT